MCNEYTESVLHPSEMKSQIVQNTIEKNYGKKHSTDCSSNYSGKSHLVPSSHPLDLLDSHCQTYEQQWQTIIQNGQINLSRVQTSDESTHHQTNGTSNTKKDGNHSILIDHNIHSKVQFQLDMLDCNYEQDKREYYAQLIRDLKKPSAIWEFERELKSQVNERMKELQLKKICFLFRKINIKN